MDKIILENAIQMARQTRLALLAIYLPDPSDEHAAAVTPRPTFLADAMDANHAVLGHLLNLKDTLTFEDRRDRNDTDMEINRRLGPIC